MRMSPILAVMLLGVAGEVWAAGYSGPRPWLAEVHRFAQQHRVDPALVIAIVDVESQWDRRAVSPKGAKGLMQLMPETARRYGVRDVFDPAENIEAGTRHLRYLLDTFRGDLRLALAAYNAGEQAVRSAGGVPPIPETRAYVTAVMSQYALARATAGLHAASAPPSLNLPGLQGPARVIKAAASSFLLWLSTPVD